MNKMNKCLLLALSSMFAFACYAGVVTLGIKPIEESVTFNVAKDPCAHIGDPAKHQECVMQQRQMLN